MLFNSVSFLAAVVCAISAPVVQAAHSFAGSNLYYAAGLSSADRTTLFKYAVFFQLLQAQESDQLCSRGMQSANMKVLRVWINGQSETDLKVCIYYFV